MTLALLGIDIGTSSCKGLLLDAEGRVLAACAEGYGLSRPRPGWTEQDPAVWIEGARRAVARVLAEVPGVEIGAVGLSGQMHGMTPLDDAHRVIRPAILWNDQRNAAECDWVNDRVGGPDRLLSFTNNRMLIGYTGGKILWMRANEPDLYARLRFVLNPKDYLRLVMTGERATEVSDASGTGLFDVRRRVWADELIDILGLDRTILPPVCESHEVTGRISPSGAELFGLPRGVPVVGGGGDSVIQTLGSGVIQPGELQTTIGTAGIVACAILAPLENRNGILQVFCNVAPDLWHCMGVSLNAGGAMSWFRDVIGTFCRDKPLDFDTICARAEASRPGSGGVLFLPYLNGERCPHPDPLARGAFVGLTSHHSGSDLCRAVMEGVTHSLYDIYTEMRAMGIEQSVIKASGGGARSTLWCQMQADLFGSDVVTTEGAAEGAAFGAALVAGIGIGVWTDAASAAQACRPMTRVVPVAAAGAAMARAYEIYRKLYSALRPSNAALSDAMLDR